MSANRREMIRRGGDVRSASRITLPNGTVGGEGRCRRCGAEVVWAPGRGGKMQPFDRDGELHAISCADLQDDR